MTRAAEEREMSEWTARGCTARKKLKDGWIGKYKLVTETVGWLWA